MISEGEVNRYLQIARDLGNSHRLFDAHVHPFEIVFNSLSYHRNPTQKGLYSTDSTKFRPPAPAALRLGEEAKAKQILNPNLRPEILELGLKMAYRHTGPHVLGYHMDMCGIANVLLLPVARSGGPIDTQLDLMEEIFGDDPRFLFACSIPNSIGDKDINSFIKEKTNRFKISAVKLHPNITEINLGTKYGIERAETILQACKQFSLPLIVHGGRNPILRNPEAASYGVIDNLRNIDWGISNTPVVIAHAATYGCEFSEIKTEILPSLKKLLLSHDNLMVDLSGGLDVETLALLLKSIEHNRVLFGSDALYNPQWSEIAKLLFSIEKTVPHAEETFIKIASLNPVKVIFKNSGR